MKLSRHRSALGAGILVFSGAIACGALVKEYDGYKPTAHADPDNGHLEVRDGFLQFIEPSELRTHLDALPKVTDAEVEAILGSEDTMWYDDDAMVFGYQDSVETVTGFRANHVGRDVGERNANSVIGKLKNYFNEKGQFRFPFATVAGADDVAALKSLNFWAPPKQNGETLPVRYWRAGNRGRWSWTFPVGTYFGEVLYQKAPSGEWVVFEVRTRKRYLDGWGVNVFRPFGTAQELAQAVKSRRPNWSSNGSLKAFVAHLENDANLKAHTMKSQAFAKIFPAIEGALDLLPAVEAGLITELLTETPFRSMEGQIWKSDGTKETYAPGAASGYSIVPGGYKMGMIPVNDISCNRCHEDTGRYLGEFDFDIQLYGEIWGEDRIFTWHLFQPKRQIHGTFDDADGSRTLNSRMVQAGLLKQGKPADGDTTYKPLPKRYTQTFQ